MKKALYFLVRIISVILLFPAFISAIPGFILMILADEINPEDPTIEK
jgi:hypothetical protein